MAKPKVKNLEIDSDYTPASREQVSVTELNVDRSYQRGVTLKFVQEIVNNFDVRKVGTILVSRRADGSLWIIEGSHRAEAYRVLKIPFIWADVYEGLTPADEAAIFYGHSSKRGLTPTIRFRALITSGDPVAVDIERILAQRGHSIMNERFRAVIVATWIYGGAGGPPEKGPTILEWALDVYLDAWPPPVGTRGSKSYIDGMVLEALALIRGRHPQVERKEMARKLATVTVDALKAEAKPISGGSVANRIAFVIVNRYNYKRQPGKKLPQWILGTRTRSR